MKIKLTLVHRVALLVLLSTSNHQLSTAHAQGTAFTYQGRLNDGANPANGTYDFVFAIYGSATGTIDGFANQTNSATPVSNGLFTVTLNLGLPGIFTGPDRWLDIAVRTNGNGAFTTLAPRQQLTPTPYAITAGNVVSNGLATGTYGSAVTFNNAANSFSGNGSGLAYVNALTLGGIGSAGFWQTAGNAGTTAGPNYLGTTDNQPLELHVDGQRALRIEPTGGAAPNLIGGYYQNSAGSFHAVVIAGGGTSASLNQAAGDYAFIGAGHGAQAGSFSAIVDGGYNVAAGQFSFVGSGLRQTNLADFSFIGSGSNNLIQANSIGSFVGGGFNNMIANNAFCATISGGIGNQSYYYESTIGGGESNSTTDVYATIGGGSENTAALTGTVGGGSGNSAIGTFGCTVAGGSGNTANGSGATVAGGVGNQAILHYAAIGGGTYNTASGQSAVVGGGGWDGFVFAGNQASGNTSVIGGGHGNTASGNYATVPGGSANVAAGTYSVAAGQQAQALHQGAFVWADSQNAAFASTGSDTFNVRAQGGVQFVTSGGGLSIDGQIRLNSIGGFSQSSVGNFSVDAPFIPGGRLTVLTNGNVGIGNTNPTNKLMVVSARCDGSSWINASDRNLKQGFAGVDAQAVLARVAALPVTTWSYKAQPEQKHLGPVAQDFHAAFGLGADDVSIATVDESGVALAAIQGLNQKLEERSRQLEMENAELKQRLDALEQKIRN